MRHPLGVAAVLLASASVAAFGGAATTLSPVAPLLLRPKSAVSSPSPMPAVGSSDAATAIAALRDVR